jgi:predicted metal-dependent hydrolase
LQNREAAREMIKAKLEQLNSHYQLNYKQVKIKNQKSRWGSCSRRGNLNFNYKVCKLPAPLADYIIAHELCHLAEFNHSEKFWRLVAQTIPDWRARRKALNRFSVAA